MRLDETKPPTELWKYDERGNLWYLEIATKTLVDAHRIAQAEAEPFVVAAELALLERLAAWIEDPHGAGACSYTRQDIVADLRAMSRGEASLP